MKISISLNQPVRRYAKAAGIILMMSGFILVIAGVILVSKYISLRTEYPLLKEHLVGISDILNVTAGSVELPPEVELRKMRDRVQALNSRTIVKGVYTIRLLDWLEENLPDNVYLVEFQHRPGEGDVLLVAEAPNSNEFTSFLNHLEHEQWFSDAILNKKEILNNANNEYMQYELRIRIK
jgi:hypothetical protein